MFSKFSIFYLITLVILFTVSCQTFPRGESLRSAQHAAQEAETPEVPGDLVLRPPLSTADLYRYFTMCRIAWKERDSYKDTGWDLDYFYDEQTNTLALAILENGALHLVFRSSQAPKNRVDLKYNARIRLVGDEIFQDKKIRAHRGFLEKYHAIRPQILERFHRFGGEGPVYLLGHSGGAVLASLAFIDLKQLSPDTDMIGITYGMVRVFNRHGAAWFEPYYDQFLRIVNGRDPFPNLPPALLGYRHIGRLIRIGNRPIYRIFSSYDHYRGYRKVLQEMLIEEGKDPAMVLTSSFKYPSRFQE